jgi:hypothetical protein
MYKNDSKGKDVRLLQLELPEFRFASSEREEAVDEENKVAKVGLNGCRRKAVVLKVGATTLLSHDSTCLSDS